MKVVSVHPDMAKAFDSSAARLLDRLLPVRASHISPANQDSEVDGRFPDVHIVHTFVASQVEMGVERTVLPSGRVVAIYFPTVDGSKVGFGEASYGEFDDLVHLFAGRPEINQYVSAAAVADALFDWYREVFNGKRPESASTFLLQHLGEAILDYEVWVPLAMTYVKTDIHLPWAEVKTIRQGFLNQMRDGARRREGSDKDALIASIDEEENKVRGLAAVVSKIQAEKHRAREIGLANAERAAMILRFFSAPMMTPGTVSLCVPLGHEHEPIDNSYLFAKESLDVFHGANKMNAHPILIDDEKLSAMIDSGFQRVTNFVGLARKNEFQEHLFDSFVTMCRSALLLETGDKLTYMFTALETMLLKDRTESITESLAVRFAFIVGSSPAQRGEIRDRIKRIYRERSNMIHHGTNVRITEDLERFFLDVWTFFLQLILDESKWLSKEVFLKSIDQRILA